MTKDEEIKLLKAELKILRTVCAEAYQVVGAMDNPPIKALDNLSAAAQRMMPPHKSMLNQVKKKKSPVKRRNAVYSTGE